MTTDQEMGDAEALVWACNASALASQPPLLDKSWARVIQQEVIEDAPIFSGFIPPGKEFLKIVAIVMAKDEEDIIYYTLHWLHYIGVRRFVIIENNSSDRTPDLIENFRSARADCEALVISDKIFRYIQSEKMTGAMQLAISVWGDCDWVLPVDCDEFLIPQFGLEALANLDNSYDAIVIPKVNHYAVTGATDSAANAGSLFDRMPIRTGKWALPPKLILRANSVYRIGGGNHQIFRADGTATQYARPSLVGCFYREFQVRSFEHFKQKVKSGGPAVLEANQTMGRNTGSGHWVAWYKEFLAGGDGRLQEIYEESFTQVAEEGFIFDKFNYPIIEC